MRIVYMGTPDFAVPPLEMLVEAGQDVVLVVTNPDRPQKRGKKVQPSPVKSKAVELGLPVSQPETVKGNTDFFNQVTDASPDLIVVAAYGKILPLDILQIPRFGAINIHASLLPKFRGAAPIHRAIECGETETGITLMYMAEGLDEGDILAVDQTDVGCKNTGQLHDELAVMGGKLLISKLADIESGNIKRTPQDSEKATYASKIEKEDAHIDFSMDGVYIERLIRAMTPFPGAYAFLDDKKMKITEAQVYNKVISGEYGQIVGIDDSGIEVKAGGDSVISIKKLQMPGKKVMDTASFLRGNKLTMGQLMR